jgi:hypothetical protein
MILRLTWVDLYTRVVIRKLTIISISILEVFFTNKDMTNLGKIDHSLTKLLNFVRVGRCLILTVILIVETLID